MLTTILALVLTALNAPLEQPTADFRAQPRLIAPTLALTPGRSVELGVHFKMQSGWHIYWPGQNDSGFETTVNLKLPEHFTAQPIRWPAPMRHTAPGNLLDHVYEGEVTLLIPIQVPPEAAGTSVTITASLEWVACAEACVFEKTDLSITIPVAKAGEAPSPSPELAHFEKARARMPRPLDPEKPAVLLDVQTSSITLTAAGASELAFFPAVGSVEVADLARTGSARGEKLSLRLAESPVGSSPRVLRGVVEVRRAPELQADYYLIERALQ